MPQLGLHTLSGCIRTVSPYITPVPSQELISLSTYTLARDFGRADDTYRLGYLNMGNGMYGGGTEGRTIGPTDTPDYRNSPNKLTDAQTLDLSVRATLRIPP
jgi:hypothetical protein